MKQNYRSDDSAKLDRKTVERNRRMHMKGLCFKLSSLIPNHHHYSSKDVNSQLNQLDHAVTYLKKLQGRVEELKIRKQQYMMPTEGINNDISNSMMIGLRLPVLELRDMGSTLEVVLISGLNKNFMFYQVISVLEEEGAEVVFTNFSVVGDKIFHTIHSQVKNSRVGVETSRLCERLKELVY